MRRIQIKVHNEKHSKLVVERLRELGYDGFFQGPHSDIDYLYGEECGDIGWNREGTIPEMWPEYKLVTLDDLFLISTKKEFKTILRYIQDDVSIDSFHAVSIHSDNTLKIGCNVISVQEIEGVLEEYYDFIRTNR